ncbi:EF-hand calcium-binding domain-containing protein 6 [Chamberlinius hualienensis]
MEHSKKSNRFRSSSAVITRHRSPTNYHRLSVNNYPRNNKVASSDALSVYEKAVSFPLKENVRQTSSTSSVQSEELFQAFIKRIRSHSSDFVKVWNIFSNHEDPEKRVLNVHFRLMLDHLYLISNEQMFQRLLKYLQPQSPYSVSYRELVTKLLNQQILTQHVSYDNFDRTASLEEIEIELRNKLVKDVAIACKMFLALDRKKTGLIHMNDLKKIIKHCCQLTFSETAFNKILLRYDPRHSEFINYRDFLKRLAINVSNYYKTYYNLNMRTALSWPDVETDQFDSHQKRLAILKGENEPELKDLTLEEIYKKLQSKVLAIEQLLNKGFLVLDYNDTGRVPREAFRILLSYFTLALSATTFNQLLSKMDVLPAEDIEWKTCLGKLKGKLAQNNKFFELDQPQNSAVDTKRSIINKRFHDLPLVDQVSRIIHQCDASHGPQLLYHFNYKANNQPCITRLELKSVLTKLGVRMNQQQFKQLTVILDPDHTNLIPYDIFNQIFRDSIPDTPNEKIIKNERNDESPSSPNLHNKVTSRASSARTYRSMPWSLLQTKLKERVYDNYDTIEKVLRSCDYQSQGLICSSQLKKLLDNFCFKLSNEEYITVLHALQDVDGMINIRRFNNVFYQSKKERLQRWSSIVDSLTKPGLPHIWTKDQLDDMWTQLQATYGKQLLLQFKRLQEDNLGLPSKQIYHSLVCAYTGWLYEEEYTYIWDTYLWSILNNMDKMSEQLETEVKTCHGDVIEEKVPSVESDRTPTPVNSNCDEFPIRPDSKPSRPRTTSTLRKNTSAEKRPKTVGPCGYFAADLSLRQIIAKKWFQIKRQCEERDAENTFTISAHEFINILQMAGVPVTSKYLQKVLSLRYNASVTDPHALVNYVKFLTDIFLACQPNKKALPDKIGSILLDIRKPILSQWKILKKSFYKNDLMGTGEIQVSRFLSIIKQQVKLSDDDINHLTKYFDPQITGTIRYKDFLHIFMKSVV